MSSDDPADTAKSAPTNPALLGEISARDVARAGLQKDRISQRVEVGLDAGVRQSGASSVSVQVMDLSIHGFRIKTHLSLREGADLWLRLPGLEARHAKVAWVRGNMVGCSFEQPLHDAVLDLIISKAGGGSIGARL